MLKTETQEERNRMVKLNANVNTVVCPNCQSEIPLSDAVTHQVREQLNREFQDKQRQLESSIRLKEGELAQEKERVEKAKLDFEKSVTDRVESERQQLLAKATEQAQQQMSVLLKDLQSQVTERDAKLRAAESSELNLRKKQRELESRAQSLELEVARKLDEERGKIREEAKRQASQEDHLRLADKEHLIKELQKQIETLRLKVEQGSQQRQGEVLEQNLETLLTETFPHDIIEPVAKGVRGADVLQRVRTSTGQECGTIIWETKRTKTWGTTWIGKLKEDQRTAKAELAVIVSQCLPEDVRHFAQINGVWVCEIVCALPVASALRQGLIAAAVARMAESGKQDKMEEVYGYLCGTEFRQHVEAIVETCSCLDAELSKEKRAMEKIWAGREKQIKRTIRHTALLYGGIQGIAGRNALPEIHALQLEQPANQEARVANLLNDPRVSN